MSLYIAESHDHAVDHGGRTSQGVIGDHKGKEKIYLHVLPVSDAEVKRLKPRVDEDGNVEHARLALPGNEVWWIAVEGEAAWHNLHRPRITSQPTPIALEDLERLRKTGVPGI